MPSCADTRVYSPKCLNIKAALAGLAMDVVFPTRRRTRPSASASGTAFRHGPCRAMRGTTTKLTFFDPPLAHQPLAPSLDHHLGTIALGLARWARVPVELVEARQLGLVVAGQRALAPPRG